MRRFLTLIVAALVAAALALPAMSGAAPVSAPAASGHAAKLKRCKAGANAKKCRCPKGQKLVKSHRKYRCKKKKPPVQQGDQTQGDNTNTDPGTGTTTDPGTGTGTTTDPGTGTGSPPAGTGSGAQTERDDAGYRAALAGSRFGPRNDESSTGYSTHTYDFCQSTFSYHYEYVGVGNGEAYYNGNWTVEQGYRVIQSQYGPGWAGILIMTENDGKQARIELDFSDTGGAFYVGTGSDFTGGQFSRSPIAC